MAAQHLSKEHKDAHLGITNKGKAEISAEGTATLTADNERHELRRISTKTRGAD
jgi:hypothetical protein